MAVSFNVPKSPSRSVIQIENFLGADFTNSAANMDTGKSPNCINMIRDVPGKVRKCMGYETVEEYSSTSITGAILNTARGMIEGTVNAEALNYITMVNTPKISVSSSSIDGAYYEENPLSPIGHYLVVGYWSVDQTAVQIPLEFTFESTYAQWSNATDEDRAKLAEMFRVYDGDMSVTIPDEDLSYGKNFTDFDVSISIEKAYEDAELYYKIRIVLSMIYTASYIPGGGYDSKNVMIGGVTINKDVSDTARINGFHKLRNDEYGLLHIGETMRRNGELLYVGANDARSKSWEFDEHLYILDGKKMLRYGMTKPESDTRYRASKAYNNIVVGETVSLTVKAFAKKQYSLSITSKSTTSPNGKFSVSKDKRSIVYTDKLTSIGQDITYSCSYKYKSSSSATTKTGSVPTHHLLGISGEGEYSVSPVEEDAYIPLVTIAKNPAGGGTPYEDLNLLTPWFEERYQGDGSTKVFHSSFKDWDEADPIVKILNYSTGEWVEQAEGTYTVNYAEGTVTFGTAPGAVQSGEDNVSITACRTVERYVDRINHCTFGILYGVNGAQDRLFVSGNPDYKNYDWFSQKDDPTYFADTSYSYLGTSASAIVGYSVISNYLATHKDKFERDQNIILREGDMIDSEPSFRIINTLQGAGAVAPYSFAYLSTEPIFLTEQGVFAVTAQDITGEKYAQDRSFFLNGALLKEENLQDAYACVFNDMYWLCLNDKAYILDGLQSIRTDRSDPYATRQYAGFYRENLPARVMWEDGGRLFFGTEDGKVCRFFNDKYANSSYNDNGEPIIASWETPDINGQVFFKNKTLRHIAIKLDSSIATSVKIYVLDRGLYNFVKEDDTIRELWEHVNTDTTSALYFSFANLIFSRLSFSTDQTQHTLPTKVRVKKVDKFRVKFVNDALNEPFAIFNVGFEYIERNNYKG